MASMESRVLLSTGGLTFGNKRIRAKGQGIKKVEWQRPLSSHYVRFTGFNLLECEMEKHRSSDFSRIKIVARIPQAVGETTEHLTHQIDIKDGPSRQAIPYRLWRLEYIGRIGLSREQVKKKTQRLLRRPEF